jgi:hypothetical protein
VVSEAHNAIFTKP